MIILFFVTNLITSNKKWQVIKSHVITADFLSVYWCFSFFSFFFLSDQWELFPHGWGRGRVQQLICFGKVCASVCSVLSFSICWNIICCNSVFCNAILLTKEQIIRTESLLTSYQQHCQKLLFYCCYFNLILLGKTLTSHAWLSPSPLSRTKARSSFSTSNPPRAWTWVRLRTNITLVGRLFLCTRSAWWPHASYP